MMRAVSKKDKSVILRIHSFRGGTEYDSKIESYG
jgi:hypothetical protein